MTQCSECGSGADYSAIVAIGVKIPSKDFYRETDTKHRGCYHRAQNTHHCPQCGSVMWIPDRPTCVLPCSKHADHHRPNEVEDATGHKYPVIYSGAYKPDFAIVATHFIKCTDSGWEDDYGLLPPASPERNASLKGFLEAYDLWNEDKFGTWCVLFWHD